MSSTASPPGLPLPSASALSAAGWVRRLSQELLAAPSPAAAHAVRLRLAHTCTEWSPDLLVALYPYTRLLYERSSGRAPSS